LPDAWLMPTPAGITRGLDRRGEALVSLGNATRYGIQRIADCSIEPIALPGTPVAPNVRQVTADGSVLYEVFARQNTPHSLWLLRRGTAKPVQVAVPAGVEERDFFPVVSNDAGWLAWTRRLPDRTMTVELMPVEGGERRALTHRLFQMATLTLVELDGESRTLTINRDLNTFAAIDYDGAVLWGPATPGVEAQSDTFRYLDGQWLAWDAYVEGRAKRAAWSTRAGSGIYTVPLGRGVTSAALSASGRYVAFSTTTELNIGSIQDTVIVRRTSDGREVFRRTLPSYARSHVAFLGEHHFAYTGIAGSTATTRVLRLPD
jgi:hypothetical protein